LKIEPFNKGFVLQEPETSSFLTTPMRKDRARNFFISFLVVSTHELAREFGGKFGFDAPPTNKKIHQ